MLRHLSRLGLIVLAPLVLLALARLVHHHARGRHVAGGITIADAGVYDRLTGTFLGLLFRSIAADIASVAAPGARILEVGCGPGHLSTRLAHAYNLDVTGMELDPAMIERARAKAARLPADERDHVAFTVAMPPQRPLTTRRSTLSSARFQCTTGRTHWLARWRSHGCCDPAARRSSETSNLVVNRSMATSPIWSRTSTRVRFAWSTSRRGVGRGGCRFGSASSWCAPERSFGVRSSEAYA
jgi:Methyltransferase domain